MLSSDDLSFQYWWHLLASFYLHVSFRAQYIYMYVIYNHILYIYIHNIHVHIMSV